MCTILIYVICHAFIDLIVDCISFMESKLSWYHNDIVGKKDYGSVERAKGVCIHYAPDCTAISCEDANPGYCFIIKSIRDNALAPYNHKDWTWYNRYCHYWHRWCFKCSQVAQRIHLDVWKHNVDRKIKIFTKLVFQKMYFNTFLLRCY